MNMHALLFPADSRPGRQILWTPGGQFVSHEQFLADHPPRQAVKSYGLSTHQQKYCAECKVQRNECSAH
jgi:hypothetical protein